jgi:hypothetical protein
MIKIKSSKLESLVSSLESSVSIVGGCAQTIRPRSKAVIKAFEKSNPNLDREDSSILALIYSESTSIQIKALYLVKDLDFAYNHKRQVTSTTQESTVLEIGEEGFEFNFMAVLSPKKPYFLPFTLPCKTIANPNITLTLKWHTGIPENVSYLIL